jgi:hypothetical protein
MVMKCVEGTRTEGEGAQEYTQTLDGPHNYCILLFSYIFLQTTFFEVGQGNGKIYIKKHES